MAGRHRLPVGIFEAAILLVVAGMAIWLLRPLPGAVTSAGAERAAMAALGAVADGEDQAAGTRRGAPFLRLDRLLAASPATAKALQAFAPSKVPGVYGSRLYWLAVLLPGREGWIAGPGAEDPGEASRGYVVVAWPRREAPDVLRALAALPAAGMWQRVDGMEESGDPAVPPVPRVVMPYPHQEPRVPIPPPDWAIAKKRR